MREIYNDWVASGRNDASISTLSKDEDPFYDEGVDITIGKALIYLEPLNYLMNIEERTSIYDFKGKSMGDAVVEVGLFADTECTVSLDEKYQVEELQELNGNKIVVRVRVLRVQGIPSELSRNVYVSFGFWSVDNLVQSKPHDKVTINPELNFLRYSRLLYLLSSSNISRTRRWNWTSSALVYKVEVKLMRGATGTDVGTGRELWLP